jgi:hypothetical protein
MATTLVWLLIGVFMMLSTSNSALSRGLGGLLPLWVSWHALHCFPSVHIHRLSLKLTLI